MKGDEIRKFAEKIADTLFRSGMDGEKVEYLMLTNRQPSGLAPGMVDDHGSWAEEVVADRIEEALRKSRGIVM